MTRLGFGCATLMRLGDVRARARILAIAYEQGIRHFDVAPTYGFGLAEGELGRFLVGKRDQVTIATKFGMNPSPLARMLNPFQAFIRPILRISKVSRRLPGAGRLLIKPKRFDPSSAMRSLRSSLRALRTEYVDMFFLHEPSSEDFIDPALLPVIAEQVQRGTIRSIGVAGSVEHSGGAIVHHPEFRGVVQIGHDVLGQQLQRIELGDVPLIITYGAIERPLLRLRGFLAQERVIAGNWSRDLDVDLQDPQILPRLLFGYAIETNASGMVLFSSTQAAHVRQMVQWFRDQTTYAERVRRLAELIRHCPQLTQSV